MNSIFRTPLAKVHRMEYKIRISDNNNLLLFLIHILMACTYITHRWRVSKSKMPLFILCKTLNLLNGRILPNYYHSDLFEGGKPFISRSILCAYRFIQKRKKFIPFCYHANHFRWFHLILYYIYICVSVAVCVISYSKQKVT